MSHDLPGLAPRLQAEIFLRGSHGGLPWKRRPDNAAVLVEFHAQREAHLHQYIFDLVERFAAEVLGLQHFVLALLHEFADGLDVGILQAIVGAHGKFQLFDGAIEILEARIVRNILRHFHVVHRLLKVDEDAHVVLDQLGGETDGILRRNRTVGPHFDHQFFVVGHLAETRGFHGVVHFADGRVHAVHRYVADGQVFIVVAVRSDVTAAVLDAHFDLQFAAFANRGNVHALVEDGEVRVFFDLRRGDGTGLLDVYVNRFGQVGVELDGHLLQVEDNVCSVFDDARDRGKFVQHALDLHGGDRCALDGAEQRAAQSIAYGGSPAALKGLRGEAAVFFGQRLQFRCETLWLLKTLPHIVPSFWQPRKSGAVLQSRRKLPG